MVTVRPERGTPALDNGDEIMPSPRDSSCEDVSERGHAVKGARASLVGGKGNIEAGGAVFESGAAVGREGNMDGDDRDDRAGAPGGLVDPKGVIGFMSRWSWENLGDNRLSTLLLGTADGIGEEGGE